MNSSTLFVGIDVSKLKHDVAVMTEHKKLTGKTFIVKESRLGYQQLTARLEHLQQKYQAEKLMIGLEATSEYWKNLYTFLKGHSNSFSLTVINPIRTKKFAETELRRAKTDSVNAKDIALFMVEKRPPASIDKPLVFDNIKDIDKQIYSFKKQQTMMVNKLRLELAKVAPEIEQNTKTLTRQSVLALLQEYPTAEAIAGAAIDDLRAVRYGKKQWQLPVKFITLMKALAENSIASKTGPGAGMVVQTLVRSILQCQQTIESLQNQIDQLYYLHVNEQQSLLASINGISAQTACVLEAYIGDVNRFKSAGAIVAYFGMNATVSQTGKKTKHKARLQKKGSGIVRHKLFMAMISILSRKNEPFYSYYKRLTEAGKPKLVAIVAAMRKLLVICYTMLKNNEKFDPNKK